jgi:hypothetical protein
MVSIRADVATAFQSPGKQGSFCQPSLSKAPEVPAIARSAADSPIYSVGSVCFPSTANAIERFFRAFNRFHKTRGGFQSVVSAKRALILFWWSTCSPNARPMAVPPGEAIMPEAARMPLYRLINDPFVALRKAGHVKDYRARFSRVQGGCRQDSMRASCNVHPKIL